MYCTARGSGITLGRCGRCCEASGPGLGGSDLRLRPVVSARKARTPDRLKRSAARIGLAAPPRLLLGGSMPPFFLHCRSHTHPVCSWHRLTASAQQQRSHVQVHPCETCKPTVRPFRAAITSCSLVLPCSSSFPATILLTHRLPLRGGWLGASLLPARPAPAPSLPPAPLLHTLVQPTAPVRHLHPSPARLPVIVPAACLPSYPCAGRHEPCVGLAPALRGRLARGRRWGF